MATVPPDAIQKYGLIRANEAVTELGPVWLELTEATMDGMAALHGNQQRDPMLFVESSDQLPENRIQRFVTAVGATAYQAVKKHLSEMSQTDHDTVVKVVQKNSEFVWWEAGGNLSPALRTPEQVDEALADREKRLAKFGIKRLIGLMLGAAHVARQASFPNVTTVVQNSWRLGEQLASRRDVFESRTFNIMMGLPGDQPEVYDNNDLGNSLSRVPVAGMLVLNNQQVTLDVGAIRKQLQQLPRPLPHESVNGLIRGCHVLHVPSLQVTSHPGDGGMSLLWHMTFTEMDRAGYFS